MTRSPRRLKEQVKDTVSEIPVHAARLAVMGVGRALMLTDRVRKDYRVARESGLGPVLGRLRNDAGNLTGKVVGKVAGDGRTGERPQEGAAGDTEISVGKPKPATARKPATKPKPAAKPAKPAKKPTPKATAEPAEPTAAKPAAKPAKPAAEPEAAQKQPQKQVQKPVEKPEPAKPEPTKPAAQAKATATPANGAAGKELPLADYDEATLASVRARLRRLDARQVAELRDYERAHAARADFLRMYENRINKLRGEH